MSGEIVRALLARPKFGSLDAAARMSAIAQGLNAPWLREGRAIHVVGSQGKGTVTMLAAALFDALGISCGRFISPHLINFSERIEVDGRPVSLNSLTEAHTYFCQSEAHYLETHPDETFGSFEAVTGTAFHAFSRHPVDVAVLEAGIGGRHDSTRAAGGRLIALTGIDLEHTALLGKSEIEILEDKCDICPRGGLVIAGPLSPALRTHLDAYAAQRDFSVQYTDDIAGARICHISMQGTRAHFKLDGWILEHVQTCLYGHVQLSNAAQALLLVKRWLEQNGRWPGPDIFEIAIRETLARTRLAMRFETIAKNPVTILDVAHTRAALAALMETLEAVHGARRCVALVGLSSDKQAARLIEPLATSPVQFVFTQARHRGTDPAQLAQWTAQIPTQICADPAQAFARAQDAARRLACPLIVTGSAFLCAEIKMIAAGRDPAALKFL